MNPLRVEIPGIAGNLGECVICGGNFLAEIFLGGIARMIRVEGFEGDLPVHEHCVADFNSAGTKWRDLPEGPLRKFFEAADAELKAGQA